MLKGLLDTLEVVVTWTNKADKALAKLQHGIDTLLERTQNELPDHLRGQSGVAQANVQVSADGVWLHLRNMDDRSTFHFRVDAFGWAKVDDMVRGGLKQWAGTKWEEPKKE